MLYGHTGLYKALTSHKGENKPEHNRNYFRHENRGETNCDDQIKVNTAKKTTKRKGHVNLNQPKQARDLKIQNSHIRRCILGNVVDCSGKPVFYLSYWSRKDRLQSWNCWSWSCWSWSWSDARQHGIYLLISKSRRRRQRERHQTKSLMSGTIVSTCVWNIGTFLSRLLHNNNLKRPSSTYFGEREAR